VELTKGVKAKGMLRVCQGEQSNPVLQIHIPDGLPSKPYQVYQQSAPDLCDPTFQLITGYTVRLIVEFLLKTDGGQGCGLFFSFTTAFFCLFVC